MEKLNKIWRAFFAIPLVAIAVEQLVFADFRPAILLPGYPQWSAGRFAWMWISGIALIAVNMTILFVFDGKTISLAMADLFLLAPLLFHIPYQISTGGLHSIGGWGDAFKMPVLSGGAQSSITLRGKL